MGDLSACQCQDQSRAGIRQISEVRCEVVASASGSQDFIIPNPIRSGKMVILIMFIFGPAAMRFSQAHQVKISVSGLSLRQS